MKKHQFKLTDLPTDEFSLLLTENVQRNLIEQSADKISNSKNWGKYKKLAQFLHKRCKSLSNTKLDSLLDNYITNWKLSKKYIPIDCVLELCKISNIKVKVKDILHVIIMQELNSQRFTMKIFHSFVKQ